MAELRFQLRVQASTVAIQLQRRNTTARIWKLETDTQLQTDLTNDVLQQFKNGQCLQFTSMQCHTVPLHCTQDTDQLMSLIKFSYVVMLCTWTTGLAKKVEVYCNVSCI